MDPELRDKLDAIGREYDELGEQLALPEVVADAARLREIGTFTGGPAPFEKRDRSRFLQRLDEIVQAARRGK